MFRSGLCKEGIHGGGKKQPSKCFLAWIFHYHSVLMMSCYYRNNFWMKRCSFKMGHIVEWPLEKEKCRFQVASLPHNMSYDENWQEGWEIEVWRPAKNFLPFFRTLEEAASVPVAYATAYYSLVVRGGMKQGDSVLIHSASGGVGQAAVAVALSMGCQVFATVGT